VRTLVMRHGLVLAILLGGTMAALTATAQEEGSPAIEVQVQNFAFAPDRVTVPIGAPVTWTNRDGTAHTATGPAFDTGRLGSGDSASVQFDAAWEFPYNCAFHANMAGVIVVE
jgi:plastocyanin